MDQKWLESQKLQYMQERDKEIKEAEERYLAHEKEAQEQLDGLSLKNVPAWVWIVLAAVAFPALPLLPVVVVAMVLYNKKRKQEINAALEEYRQQYRIAHDQAEKKLTQRIREDEEALRRTEKEFSRNVENAFVRYCGSSTIRPLVQFLAEHMEVRLKAADKRSFLPRYGATLRFRMDADCINVLGDLPHTDGASLTAQFILREHNLRNLPELYDQFGCARALGELLKEEMRRRAIQDGHDLGGIELILNTKDNYATLSYWELNPDYQHPQSL